MVLLKNFGAEPLIVNAGSLNCSNFVCLLPRKVTQIMMLGIPKFRKESHPGRAKNRRDQFFHSFGAYPGKTT
jgi:hypothetical protein